MDYLNAATEIYEAIGGKKNLISAAHCATRLRLILVDESVADIETLEKIDGVKGVFLASGQLQIIIGTGIVNKVYEQFIKIADLKQTSKEEVKQAAMKKSSFFQRMIKTLGDVFVPIIPAIVASGLLMGLLEGFSNLFPSLSTSPTYTIFHLFSNAAFVFLPILIAISAANVFGSNMFLGAVIGMIMIHPDLMNAWSVASADFVPGAPVWFGLYQISLVGYQGHVIPIVIAVWFMSILEKKLHKIIPEIIDLFVTPLVTVLVTGYLSLTIFGPVFSTMENWILDGVKYLITIPSGIGAFLIGGLYAPTVVAGIHHMYNALEAGLLSSNGVNIWMPIASAANVAQGSAALALALKTRNKKTKAVALPASLSAFLGITEPAIFGVNLRFFKCFLAGCIGGAVGGLVAGILHVEATAYGITGIFGYLITTNHLLGYTLVLLVSILTAFVVSWILYQEPKEDLSDETASDFDNPIMTESSSDNFEADENHAESCCEKNLSEIILSPISGEVISLKDTKDPVFSSLALGDGVSIIPSRDTVFAPFIGTVTMLLDSKHAIGLKSEKGAELLIHVGINTVELNGECFRALVSQGDKITLGQPLLQFDSKEIKKRGYDLTIPVIITNLDDFHCIDIQKYGNIKVGEKLFQIS